MEECIFDYMASHIECRFNKNSLLQCYFLAILPAGFYGNGNVETFLSAIKQKYAELLTLFLFVRVIMAIHVQFKSVSQFKILTLFLFQNLAYDATDSQKNKIVEVTGIENILRYTTYSVFIKCILHSMFFFVLNLQKELNNLHCLFALNLLENKTLFNPFSCRAPF